LRYVLHRQPFISVLCSATLTLVPGVCMCFSIRPMAWMSTHSTSTSWEATSTQPPMPRSSSASPSSSKVRCLCACWVLVLVGIQPHFVALSDLTSHPLLCRHHPHMHSCTHMHTHAHTHMHTCQPSHICSLARSVTTGRSESSFSCSSPPL